MNAVLTSRAIETAIQDSWKLLPRYANTDVFQTLVDNEFKDPADHEKHLETVLRLSLRYCNSKIPYYQDRFAALGLSPADFTHLADLSKFPILTRYDLVNAFPGLQPAGLDIEAMRIRRSRTTGSTGLPVTVLHTPECMSMFSILWQRLARWFRLDLHKRFARIRIPPDLFRLEGNKMNPDGHTVGRNSWMHSGKFFETGDEVHFNVSNSRQAQLEWLDHYRPAYLLTFPGLMEELALANNCQPLEGIESLIAISSILTGSMRSRIEQAFHLPIHQMYGLNEIGLVATRCAAGRYHENTEHAHVEIVDADGMPVGPSSSGRLLVTGLNNTAMPLLRYDTGDLATASVGNCPCGRTQPAFENVLGRYIRFAGTPEGTRPRLNGLLKVFADMPNELFANIRQYQMRQTLNRDFELLIVATGPLHDEFRTRLQQKWEVLNAEADKWQFHIRMVDEIEQTPSGKQLDFVSAFHALDADFQ